MLWYNYSMAQKRITFVLLSFVIAFIGAGAFFLFTTKNTVIVINEGAANSQREVIVAPTQPEEEPEEIVQQVRIRETGVGFLNVRDGSSTQARQIGRVSPGEVYEYTATQNNWYQIVHPELENGWVSGQYVEVLTE